MMKTTPWILLIILGIFVIPGTASAGEAQPKTYYNDYLTKKIDCCRQTASLFNACYNARIYELTKMRAKQADFYEKNRKELVDSMLSRHLGKQAHQMDYFLLNEFKIRGHEDHMMGQLQNLIQGITHIKNGNGKAAAEP